MIYMIYDDMMYDMIYDMIRYMVYDMIYDMIRYDMIWWYDTWYIWYDM